MADETNVPVTTVSAPAAPAPAAAPAPEIIPSGTTPAASTEAAPSSVVEAPPVAEAPKPETPVEGVLGAEPVVEKKDSKDAKAPELKTPEKSATETPPEAGKPAEKPTLPTYDEFKVPENIKLDKEPLDAFTAILGEIETGKLDHKGMQEAGQKLVDLATKNLAQSIDRLNDYYVELHKGNVQKRVDALKADPELGGDKFEATVSALQATVREYGGTEAQIADFRKEITESGLSASPAVCRIIYNMQQKINKYTTETNGPSIVPGQKPAPTKVKPYEAFYSGGRAS